MLERETELIIQTLVNRTIGARETMTLQEAVAADMPRGVRAYLRAEVFRWIERDFKSAPSLKNVDQAVMGVEKLAKYFLRTLADNYIFQRSEFLGMLDNAVHFLENYLCRPQWTLASFLYQNSTTTTPAEIIAKLDYFADYAYLPTLVERTLLQRTTEPVAFEDFKTLLAKIDDQVVRQHTARELATLTKPIYDFLLLCNAPDNLPVPLKPLLVFLDDKKMKIMREHMEGLCKSRQADHLTLSQLKEIFEELYLGEAKANQEEPDVQPRSEVPSTETKVEERAGPTPPDNQPSYFEEKEQTPPTAHSVPTDRDQKNISLSLTFAGLHEPPAPRTPVKELPDLNTIIPPDLSDRVIKSAFMNDVQYYSIVITALNDFPTWEEASAYIGQLCEINDLDPSSPELREFSTAVQRRYGDEGNA
jgi:hypothetical protein